MSPNRQLANYWPTQSKSGSQICRQLNDLETRLAWCGQYPKKCQFRSMFSTDFDFIFSDEFENTCAFFN